MNAQPSPIRWGPNGPVADGQFIVVQESVPVKLGHNGNGIAELIEFDDEKLTAELRRLEKDERFPDAHQAEWLEQYPDMYIAVYQEQLVGIAPDSPKLVELLDAKGIRPGATYWRFLRSKPIVMLPG